MKKLNVIIALAGALLVAGLFTPKVEAAGVSPVERANFSNAGTAIGATNSYYVVPLGNGKPTITYVSATSDASTNVLWFWKAINGAHTLVTATNASQAIVYVPDNTKYAANDVVVIRHATDDTYERRVVSATTTGYITLGSNLTSAIVAGDTIYKMTNMGKVPVGNATKEITTTGVYYGPAGLPILVEVNGTSACTLNLVAGFYSP